MRMFFKRHYYQLIGRRHDAASHIAGPIGILLSLSAAFARAAESRSRIVAIAFRHAAYRHNASGTGVLLASTLAHSPGRYPFRGRARARLRLYLTCRRPLRRRGAFSSRSRGRQHSATRHDAEADYAGLSIFISFSSAAQRRQASHDVAPPCTIRRSVLAHISIPQCDGIVARADARHTEGHCFQHL